MQSRAIALHLVKLAVGNRFLPTLNFSFSLIYDGAEDVNKRFFGSETEHKLLTETYVNDSRLHFWQRNSTCTYSTMENDGTVFAGNQLMSEGEGAVASSSPSPSDRWASLLESPMEWLDQRTLKNSAKSPDFCKTDQSSPLWLIAAPLEIQQRINDLDPCSFANTIVWGELLAEPSLWLDVRGCKQSPNSPDFVEKRGERQLWISDAPYGVLERVCTKLKFMDSSLWDSLLAEPELWIDYRFSRKAPRGPDFRRVKGRESLRLADANVETREKIDQIQPHRFANAKSWTKFVVDFHRWTDQRFTKPNPKAPDFVKTTNNETSSIWLSDIPPWVFEKLRDLKIYIDAPNLALSASFPANTPIGGPQRIVPNPIPSTNTHGNESNPAPAGAANSSLSPPPDPSPSELPLRASAISSSQKFSPAQNPHAKELPDEWATQGNDASTNHAAWLRLTEDLPSFFDKRGKRQKPGSADFICKDTGEELWLDSAPAFALDFLRRASSQPSEQGHEPQQKSAPFSHTTPIASDSPSAMAVSQTQSTGGNPMAQQNTTPGANAQLPAYLAQHDYSQAPMNFGASYTQPSSYMPLSPPPQPGSIPQQQPFNGGSRQAQTPRDDQPQQQQYLQQQAWQSQSSQPQLSISNQVPPSVSGTASPSSLEQQGMSAAGGPFPKQSIVPSPPGSFLQQDFRSAAPGTSPWQDFGSVPGPSSSPLGEHLRPRPLQQPNLSASQAPFQQTNSDSVPFNQSGNSNPSTGNSANTQKAAHQALWRDLMQNPNMWIDNRPLRKNPNAPDFKHTASSQGLWLSSAPKEVHMWLHSIGAA